MTGKSKKSKKQYATKAEQQLSDSAFFIDRCLGKQIGLDLRAKGLSVEFHADHFEDDTPDPEWLIEVGRRGWVVVTKDKNMRNRPAEHTAVYAANLKVLALSGGDMTGDRMSSNLIRQLRRIGKFGRVPELLRAI